MRSKKHPFNLVLLSVLFLLLWGCIEYTITTQIMPDGRIIRSVTVKGDSTDILRGSFRVPADSDWTVTTRYEQLAGKDSGMGNVFVYEARREFSDYQELNSFFYRDSGVSDHMIAHVILTKKPKGFFTHFEYTETYSRIFQFGTVPIQDYMTASEIRVYLSGEEEIYYSADKDSLMIATDSATLPVLTSADSSRFKQLREDLDQKFESWQKINIYSDLFHVVGQALDKMGRSADTTNARDRFYQWLDSTRVFESVMENSEAFLVAAGNFFNVDPKALKDADQNAFDEFSRKFKAPALAPETFANQVLMPGMIIHTNTTNIKGNLAIWNFKIGDFYATDYVMTVHSRLVNKIAVVIAGIVLVILVGLILMRMFRK